MINRELCFESFRTREEDEKLYIEGYFSVFNSPYVISKRVYETVAIGAFTECLNGDIRALINHDARLVLGRTIAGTLELREDSHGLFGRILINPNDQDAVNIYERVKRGDVTQCSFGFEILEQSTEVIEDEGKVHYTLNKVRLHEVSIVTFPAYQETAVTARSAEGEACLKARTAEGWRLAMLAKLEGGAG